MLARMYVKMNVRDFVESRSMVFLSGFLVSLFLSGFSFYVYRYSGIYGLVGLVGLFAINFLSVVTMYRDKATYLLGVGIGVVGGYVGSGVIEFLFRFLVDVGVNIARFVVFGVAPRDYNALALLIGLVGVSIYALMFAIYSVLSSIFLSFLLKFYRYPDLVFVFGIVLMYPFYIVFVYSFVFSLLLLVLVAVVAAFFFAKIVTAFLAVVSFVEILLFVFTGSWILPRVFANASTAIGSTIFDLYAMPYEPEELSSEMKNNLYMFLLYSVLSSVVSLAAKYYSYASIFMIGMVVAAVGLWSTYVVVQVSVSRKLSDRMLLRILRYGLMSLSMLIIGVGVGYNHFVQVAGLAIDDFIRYYSPAVWRLIYDIFMWALG